MVSNDELHKPITFASIYPFLTMAGVARHWGKGRKSVEMQVLKGRLDGYKDGAIWLIETASVVTLWGEPPKGQAE